MTALERPVCILGMGRSGTSLTARVLNLLGVDLGPESGLVERSEQNVTGYWERRAIYELNEAVLAAMGGDYANPPHLRQGWEKSPELSRLKQRARQVLDECFAESSLWGFKDPRTSLTLPFWRELIPEMRFVICLRSPAEVSASFARYPSDGGFAGKDWAQLWLRSTASAISETSGDERLFLFYEDYFDDLHAQVELLAAFIDRPATPSVLSAIEGFVDRGQRHHWLASEENVSDGRAAREAHSLYAALRRQARKPDGDSREIERIARRWHRTRTPLGGRLRQGAGTHAAPRELRRFPDDLAVPGVVSYGIFRDGWLEQDCFIVLAGGPRAQLAIRVHDLALEGQRLELLVDGRPLAATDVDETALELRVPLSASREQRRIQFRWATARKLAPPDTRTVAGQLDFLGLE